VSYSPSACSVTLDGKESFCSAGKYCTFVALGRLKSIFEMMTLGAIFAAAFLIWENSK
jgi:hypothetical protein